LCNCANASFSNKKFSPLSYLFGFLCHQICKQFFREILHKHYLYCKWAKYKHRFQSSKTQALQSEGLILESRPGWRFFWLKVFMIFFASSANDGVYPQTKSCPLFFSFLSVPCRSIMIKFSVLNNPYMNRSTLQLFTRIQENRVWFSRDMSGFLSRYSDQATARKAGNSFDSRWWQKTLSCLNRPNQLWGHPRPLLKG
jgi:hypothetical protein